jgi:2-keto-4-pentenoate hydratase/2-oxohepta-3-ene-1,7-dioic acid hydratase in catechol pathway
MKWCRFQNQNEPSFGIIENDKIIPVVGSPFTNYERSNASIPLENTKLLVPVIPQTFYAAGINYMGHVLKMAAITGREGSPPPAADIGYRANNALIAHNETILIPNDATEKVQYEGELVIVIGKTAKNLTPSNLWEYILGYTIGNDVSERTWQASDRTLWRAKNTDTFKPMGPWIETDVNPDDMTTTVKVNDTIQDQFKTNNMIFGITDYLCNMTKYLTLYPGDVVWMGTDDVPIDIKDGDVVDIEITGIGTLSNPVRRSKK